MLCPRVPLCPRVMLCLRVPLCPRVTLCPPVPVSACDGVSPASLPALPGAGGAVLHLQHAHLRQPVGLRPHHLLPAAAAAGGRHRRHVPGQPRSVHGQG